MRRKFHIVICIVLHVLFVLLHVVLLCLAFLLENPPAFPLSQTVSAPTVVVVAQGFTIIYCAGLVTTTQRLALQDMFHRRQTLSAIHDKSSAWLGLGSSAFALLRQKAVKTDLVGVIATLLYLLCISVVHTAFPGIFTVESAESPAQLAASRLNAQQVSTVLAVQDTSNISQISPDVFNFLSGYDQFEGPLAGLRNNTIYDTMLPNTTLAAYTGDIPVNITSITVNCTYISSVMLEATNSTGASNDTSATLSSGGHNNASYILNLNTTTNSKVLLTPMAPQMLQLYPHPESNSTILVASTYPVVDLQGNRSPNLNIQPPWELPESERNTTSLNSGSIQVQLMACDAWTVKSVAFSALPSQQLEVFAPPPTASNAILWHEWVAPGKQTRSPDPIAMTIRKLVSDCPRSPNNSQVASSKVKLGSSDTVVAAYVPSILEEFLWTDIVHARNVDMPSYPFNKNPQITVSELNFSLQRAFAALTWSLNNRTVDDDRKQYGSAIAGLSIPEIGSTDAWSNIQLNQVLSEISIAAATGALIVCVFIIYRSQGFKPEGKVPFVDTTGVLPVIWLLGNEPRLAEVEEPKTNALRKAGMFEIESDVFNRINSQVNLRARKAKGYESVDSHDLDSVEAHDLDGVESHELGD